MCLETIVYRLIMRTKKLENKCLMMHYMKLKSIDA